MRLRYEYFAFTGVTIIECVICWRYGIRHDLGPIIFFLFWIVAALMAGQAAYVDLRYGFHRRVKRSYGIRCCAPIQLCLGPIAGMGRCRFTCLLPVPSFTLQVRKRKIELTWVNRATGERHPVPGDEFEGRFEFDVGDGPSKLWEIDIQIAFRSRHSDPLEIALKVTAAGAVREDMLPLICKVDQIGFTGGFPVIQHAQTESRE